MPRCHASCHVMASRMLRLMWSRKMMRRFLDSKSVLLVNFLLALVNIFLLVMNLHVHVPPPEAYFYSPINQKEREQMLDLLRVLTTQLERHHILYFIASGTLLGSFRHHGPIPWDDDVDIFIEAESLPAVQTIVDKMGPQYRLYPGGHLATPIKFYSPDRGRRFLHHTFTWPYVDLFLLHGNATHYMTSELYHVPVPRSVIYPLIRRPYQGMWLFAPCNTSFLLRDYNVDECYSRSFSHLMELPMVSWTQRHVPCSRLSHMFPFVHRQEPVRRGNRMLTIETLRVDSWVLDNVTVVSPIVCDARTKKYES